MLVSKRSFPHLGLLYWFNARPYDYRITWSSSLCFSVLTLAFILMSYMLHYSSLLLVYLTYVELLIYTSHYIISYHVINLPPTSLEAIQALYDRRSKTYKFSFILIRIRGTTRIRDDPAAIYSSPPREPHLMHTASTHRNSIGDDERCNIRARAATVRCNRDEVSACSKQSRMLQTIVEQSNGAAVHYWSLSPLCDHAGTRWGALKLWSYCKTGLRQ